MKKQRRQLGKGLLLGLLFGDAFNDVDGLWGT